MLRCDMIPHTRGEKEWRQIIFDDYNVTKFIKKTKMFFQKYLQIT